MEGGGSSSGRDKEGGVWVTSSRKWDEKRWRVDGNWRTWDKKRRREEEDCEKGRRRCARRETKKNDTGSMGEGRDNDQEKGDTGEHAQCGHRIGEG